MPWAVSLWHKRAGVCNMNQSEQSLDSHRPIRVDQHALVHWLYHRGSCCAQNPPLSWYSGTSLGGLWRRFCSWTRTSHSPLKPLPTGALWSVLYRRIWHCRTSRPYRLWWRGTEYSQRQSSSPEARHFQFETKLELVLYGLRKHYEALDQWERSNEGARPMRSVKCCSPENLCSPLYIS